MSKPADRMRDLAETCEEAGWEVKENTKAFVVTPPGGKSINIPRLAPTPDKYDDALRRLSLHGLDKALAALRTAQKADSRARNAAAVEANDRKLAVAEAKAANRTTVTETISAAPAAPTVAFSSPDATVTPISLRKEIPAEFVGVAGVLSVLDADEDFDFSQIIIKPEDRPKPSKLQVTVYELITPERAFEILSREPGQLKDGTMVDQRPVSKEQVNRYVGILQRDLVEQKKKADCRPHHVEWIVAEDVKLSPEPPLNTGGGLNGWTRFTAIFESQIPAIMRVTYNTPPETYVGLDQGRKRSGASILKNKGYKNTAHLESAVKLVWAWDRWQKNPTGPYANWHNWSRLQITPIQIDAFLSTELFDFEAGESLLIPHVQPGSRMMVYITGVPAAGIAFRYLVTQAWRAVNPELGAAKLEEFCTLLHDGAGPGYEKDHPVHTLREWIDKGTGGKRDKNDKRQWQLNGMLRAWDYFANSQEYGKVIINETAPMPMPWAPGVPSLTAGNRKGARRT